MTITLIFFLVAFVVPFSAFADETVLATSEAPDGRVRASLTVSPSRPRLSDTILLTLTIDMDRTIHVESPVFGTALGDLSIIETTEQAVGADSNRETKKVILKTVPLKSGSLPIWPIPLRYTDRRDGLKEQTSTLVVPPSRINVDSAVSPETASLEKIGVSYSLIDMGNSAARRILVAVGVLLVVGIVLFLLLRRRRSVTEETPNLTPQEIALHRFRQLIESRLYESDVKKFFVELSDIVRWLIEQTSNIHAPELTTEEFLRMLGSRHSATTFPTETRDRLRQFLESADMVKFAKFQPSREEILLGCKRAEEIILWSAVDTEPTP